MSKLILIIASYFMLNTTLGQSVYSYSVTSIEGVNKPLITYQGKKLFLITLPVEQNISNDSLLHSLDSIRVAYTDSVVIIAAPSYEDGYNLINKPALQQWYRSILGNDIIITEGIYTRKTSGNQQHPLFRWLTDKIQNGHFDQDVTGPRNKFFIWKDGAMVAVLAERTRLGGTVMNELLQGQ